MRIRSNAFVAASLLSLVTAIGACEGLVDGNAPPPKVTTGTGGAAGNGGDEDGGVVIDPSIGTGGTTTGTGGAVGAGGTGGGTVTPPDAGPMVGTGGAGGAPSAMTPCGPYPAGPELAATKFELGTVVPNLSFKREDGTTVTFGDLRCNKKNKLMYWAVGGDNCPPCVSTAKMTEIPAWKELGPQGLLMIEAFNSRKFLVSNSPWMGWRTKTMWPAMDDEHILLLNEPPVVPPGVPYVMGRVANGIPWVAIVELETMKVVSKSRGSLASLRTQMAATPARP